MAYLVRKVARAHARDLVYLLRYARERLAGRHPKSLILCNSFPKSGTHLLVQIVASLPGVVRSGDIISVQAFSGLFNTAQHVRWKLGSAPDDALVPSHLTYADPIRAALAEHHVRHVFIYRDLRDVAVSHARWVMKEPRDYLHPIYRDTFVSDDERLMASIRGVAPGRPFGSNAAFADIGSRFRQWLGWLDEPDVLAVRFEDLVGERGGGDEAVRLRTIERILAHVEKSVPADEMARRFTSRAMNPSWSHTFQKGGKGQTGDWRQRFTAEHKRVFKAVAGDLLVQLGYEEDLQW